MDHGQQFLQSATARFKAQKSLADRAIGRVSDSDLRKPLHPQTNSIAVIMKHLAGNMLSRWTDFLTSDGEKEWRDRDREFIDDFDSRAEIVHYWDEGWNCLFGALASLTPDDMEKEVRIRGESHTIYDAVLRQLDHYGYHIGQIVMVARVLVGDEDWETLSIARGESRRFNETHWKK